MIHPQIAARYICLNKAELCNRIRKFEMMGENEYCYQKMVISKRDLLATLNFVLSTFKNEIFTPIFLEQREAT